MSKCGTLNLKPWPQDLEKKEAWEYSKQEVMSCLKDRKYRDY